MSRLLLGAVIPVVVFAACASIQGSGAGEVRDTIAITGLPGAADRDHLIIDRYSIRSSGEYRVDADPTDVWSALPDAYTLLGIPVVHLDPSGRQVGNRGFTVTSRLGRERVNRYIRCVTDAFGHSAAGRDRIVMSVVTTVSEADDGGATIRTDVSAVPQSGGAASAQTPCTSNGTLEHAVERAVLLVLADRELR